jgi:hypothetical protein
VVVPGLQAADRHDVDRDSEELAELVLQVQEIEQGAARLEVDQDVDVAAPSSSPRATDPKMAMDRPRWRRARSAISAVVARSWPGTQKGQLVGCPWFDRNTM